MKNDVIVHPGELLGDILSVRGIKKINFAQRLQIPPSRLSDLLHGKKAMNPDLARRLEELLAIPAAYWMNAQANFDFCHDPLMML